MDTIRLILSIWRGIDTKSTKKIQGEEFDLTNLPKFCDFTCKYASFAPADAVGACRREQAVYCTLLKEYNNKNASCAVRE